MKTSFYLRYFVFFVFMVCFLKGFSQDLENLKDHPPFKISGNLGVKLTTYQSIDRETSRNPFSWYLTGSPVVSIYGINIPFSFSVSDQQTSYKQSFSTIGASPYYKWLMLHLGYRSLQFGKFTLSGNTMLGAGFEVSLPKGLHIGYMYGRFNKAIDYEYDEAEAEDDYTITPTFKNTASSYKIGRSIAFIVDKPVKREIFAADFRDRVVHHLIIGKLNHLVEKQFIHDRLQLPSLKRNSFWHYVYISGGVAKFEMKRKIA